MIKIKAIAAQNKLGYIGLKGELPWNSSEDFAHFKKMTKGAICILGRTTFEDDLKSKKLPGREMIVIGNKTRNSDYYTMIEALQKALLISQKTKQEIWIIGGQSIYEQFMPFIDEFHLSVINDYTVGDRKINWSTNLKCKFFHYEFEINK